MTLFDFTYNNAIFIILATLVRVVFNIRAGFSFRRHALEVAFCIVTGSMCGYTVVEFTGDASYSSIAATLSAFYGSHLWRGFERIFPSFVRSFKNKLEQ
ncbi:MAG: hypothetical protein JNL32_04775 [Candidatus Kapabacteria bacterium]|nr:hypothetical protein [Candidatus Kapabacteria bacterium]